MVSAKFELRYESLKNKSSLILFAYNLVIGYSKRIEKIIRESAFDEKKKKPGLKFNPRLALTGLRTTGAWIFTSVSVDSTTRSYLFTSATVRIGVHSTPKYGTKQVILYTKK